MFGENNCLLRFFVGKAVWQSGCVWERKAVWQSGRVRASGTGGQPGGIGLSGLGQRCGELIEIHIRSVFIEMKSEYCLFYQYIIKVVVNIQRNKS